MHEIGVELEEELKAKGCPLPVVDGPEFDTTTWGNDRIVIEPSLGDTFQPPHVSQGRSTPADGAKSKVRYVRNMGMQVRIFAHVAVKGAQPFEHRRLCDHALDSVLWALARVVAKRKNRLALKGGDYYIPKDLAAADVPMGCAYELHFTIDRGVPDLTWKYGKAGEFTIQGVDVGETVPGTESDLSTEADLTGT